MGETTTRGISSYPPFPHSPIPPFTFKPILALMLGLLVLPYFVNLSGPSLWDSTEAFYAETPREMIELNSYVVPYFNYEPRLNKPPLSYWLVIPFYRVFGVSQVAERAVNALGASLLILLTLALGNLIFGQHAGLLSAAMVATTPRLLLIGQKSIIDTYFTLFVTAALFFFWLIVEREKAKVAVALFYVALGLSVLTKGPLGLGLVGGVIVLYVLATRHWELVRRMNLLIGIFMLAAIILPWYIAIYLKLGWEPIATFIFRENVGRFTSDIDWSNRGSFYYVSVLLGDFFPWSLFLVPAGIFSFRTWQQEDDRRRTILYLLVWIAFIFIFFSLARNKHEYYLLPLYPAAAVLVGWLFVRLTVGAIKGWEQRSARMMTMMAGILFVVGGVILGFVLRRIVLAPGASYTSLILVIGGLWILWQTRTADLRRLPVTLVALMLMSMLLYRVVYLPLIEQYRPTRVLSGVIEKEAGADDLIGSYNFAAPSLTFYLRRKTFEVFQPEVIHEILRSEQRVFCLVPEKDYRQLEKMVPGRLTILQRRPMLTLRLNALWDVRAREKAPYLLLITNRPHPIADTS